MNFKSKFGDDVFFDINGDPPASYDVINWQLKDGHVQHVTVGHFASSANGDHELSIRDQDIVWRTEEMVIWFFLCVTYNCCIFVYLKVKQQFVETAL